MSGTIGLCYVPPKVKLLEINSGGGSKLTGQINLAHLPDGLRYILLRNNQLTGSLSITNVPPNMCFIDMQFNNFNSVAVVHSKTHANIKLQESGVTSVVDENGKELDSKRFFS